MLRRLLVTSFALLSTTLAWSASYKVLYAFGRTAETPSSGLVFDSVGNAYGTTATGGINGGTKGIVYRLSAKTGFTILYSFSGPDGWQPQGNLAIDSTTGNLYGTTVYGGSDSTGCNNQGCGTVFRLSPPTNGGVWTETVLYSFTDGEDGANPQAGVILDSAGTLYGSAEFGGGRGVGTIFALTPSPGDVWTETVLYAMEQGGGNPLGGLVFDSSGNLYGTTSNRGPGLGGTVFQLSPNIGGVWAYTLLYGFDGSNGSKDGNGPAAGVIFDGAGNLYGTTGGGGAFAFGTIFELAPSQNGQWVETILYSFAGGSDGATPMSSLAFDGTGNLYGTTFAGGSPGFSCLGHGCGTVFELTPDQSGQWQERRFVLPKSGKLGVQPTAPLVFDQNGNAYGTNTASGSLGDGVAFRVSP